MSSLGKLIDTHAHLHDAEFSDDFDAVITRARAAGVERIVLIGETIANSETALRRAKCDTYFGVTVGVHPHRANEFADTTVSTLRNLACANPCVIGIGEIGLDYHYNFAPRDLQQRAFLAQFESAQELRLPVVIHCRKAYDEILKLLPSESLNPNMPPRGVLHCFFGSLWQAHEFIRRGFFLGIGGAVTFKSTRELQEIVQSVPLNTLVLETDAPYMAPVPHRGKRNEPSFLPLVAARVAELRGCSAEEVANITTQNAKRLFRLD